VYDVLTGLSKYRIVRYIPRKKTPLIIYTQTREEVKYLRIPPSAYEERKERFEHRIARVLDYMDNESHCRSRMLLAYFGEEDTDDCGHCDVCRAKKASGLASHEFDTLRTLLEKEVTAAPLEVKTLIQTLPFPAETTLAAIRFLTDRDTRFTLEDGYLHVVPPS
jgi:ATP-dependent DNA helicase RecQ